MKLNPRSLRFFPPSSIIKFLFTSLIFPLFQVSSVYAQTNVSGMISSNTTWGVANSPYIVTGNVTVAGGVTLTIEPGVQVKFAGYYALDTNGILNAQGTAANMIKFTSNNATPTKGNWNYIYLKNSASIISYAVIEYADNGVYTANSSPTIQNSTIQNNNTGIYTHSLAPILQSNLIQNNTTGINVLGTASTKVMNNTITNNTTYGVYVTGGAGGQITGNTITGNSYGIYFLPTTVQAIAMPVNNNGIYNNGSYNLYAAAGTGSNNFSNKEIDAKSNWWGTADTSIIMAKIFDVADNVKAPNVDVSILLDSPGGNPLQGRHVHGSINANQSWSLVNSPYMATFMRVSTLGYHKIVDRLYNLSNNKESAI